MKYANSTLDQPQVRRDEPGHPRSVANALIALPQSNGLQGAAACESRVSRDGLAHQANAFAGPIRPDLHKPSTPQHRRSLGLTGLTALFSLMSGTTLATDLANEQLPSLLLQSTAMPFRQFWNVEVTGSSMLSGESRQALPVQVFDRKDIDRSGATNLAEFVQSLPLQINGSNLGNLAPGIAASGPLAASVRGLAASTLVLLNGRRLPKFSRATVATERTSVDLNIVPLSAVERIDVLTDGASAHYGSDAAAGVINIVTFSDYKHATVGVDVAHPLDSGGQTQTAYMSWGDGDVSQHGWDGQVHLSLTRSNNLKSQERESTSSQLVPVPGGANGEYFKNGLLESLSAWPAVVIDPNGRQVSPLPVNGQCDAGWVNVTIQGQAVCRYNPATDTDVYPELSSASLYTQWRYRLASDTTLFAELAWGQRTTVGSSVPATWSQPAWTQSLSNGNTAHIAPTPLGVGQYRFDGHYYRGSLGVQGYAAPWTYQSSVYVGRRNDDGASGGWINTANNSSNLPALGWTDTELTSPATPAVLSRLQTSINPQFVTVDQGRSSQDGWQAQASRTITSTDNGDITLGTGVSWSRESIWTRNEFLNPNTQALDDPIAGQRHVAAVHAELEYPASSTTVLGLQLRHDHYSDVGEITTGKLALRYQPNPRWMWRASAGTGFRAPTLEQRNGVGSTFYAHDIARSALFFAQGNTRLQAENSEHLSLGLRLQPSPAWTAGLDYWRLNVRNGIQLLSRDEILSNPSYKALFWSQDSNGVQRFTLQPMNLAQRTQSGVDYDLQYRKPTDWGRIRTKVGGTLFLTAQRKSAIGLPTVSEIGELYDGFSYIPRHRLNALVALEKPRWQTWLQLHFISGNYESYSSWNANTQTTQDGLRRRVPGYATLDWGWRYVPSTQDQWSVQIINLTDSAPPYRYRSRGNAVAGIQTAYGDYRGRSLRVQYEHRFR